MKNSKNLLNAYDYTSICIVHAIYVRKLYMEKFKSKVICITYAKYYNELTIFYCKKMISFPFSYIQTLRQ